VDFEIAKLYQAELKKFLYPESVGKYGVDGYIIVTYSEGSESQQATTKADVAFWLDHFGRTKPNRQRKRAPKGFLEIIV